PPDSMCLVQLKAKQNTVRLICLQKEVSKGPAFPLLGSERSVWVREKKLQGKLETGTGTNFLPNSLKHLLHSPTQPSSLLSAPRPVFSHAV
ncbi:mCG55085, partial [Mus musculus]